MERKTAKVRKDERKRYNVSNQRSFFLLQYLEQLKQCRKEIKISERELEREKMYLKRRAEELEREIKKAAREGNEVFSSFFVFNEE